MKTLVEVIVEGLEQAARGGGGVDAKHQAAVRLANAAPKMLRTLKILGTMHQGILENLGPKTCNCDRCFYIRTAITKAMEGE